MSAHLDIVVTWPKTKPLEGYLAELKRAEREGLVINFRVARLPPFPVGAFDYGAVRPRCYMVHDGAVRGWLLVIDAGYREDGVVEGWPAGNYVIREPIWTPIRPVSMRGFQGWRWCDRYE